MNKFIITGGNKGIGKAVAMELAIAKHSVVIVVRDAQKGEIAVKDIKVVSNNDRVSYLIGDLSSIESCYQLSEKIKQEHSDIISLINNAGIWQTEMEINKDGFEKSFMVNYIAPFILSMELKDTLISNAPSRIVNVNAGLYMKGNVNLNETPFGKDFNRIKTYANTKLCNTMFTIDFAKLIADTDLTINAVHPGVIHTDLGASKGFIGLLLGLIKKLWKTPKYGAIAPTWLATDSLLRTVNGKYFNEKTQIDYAENAKDERIRKELWDKTIEWIAKPKV